MKKFILSVFVLSISSFVLYAQEKATVDAACENGALFINTAVSARMKIGVISYDAPTPALSSYIADVINSKLAVNPARKIIEKQEFDALMNDSEKNSVVKDSAAINMGKELGAQAVVIASVKKSGSKYRLALQTLNVETSAKLRSSTYTLVEDDTLRELLNATQDGAPTESVVRRLRSNREAQANTEGQ